MSREINDRTIIANKKTPVPKEKIFTVIGIVIMTTAFIGCILALCFSYSQSRHNDDTERFKGYWYTEGKDVCWVFEEQLARMYLQSENGGYRLMINCSFAVDESKKQLILYDDRSNTTYFDYSFEGRVLHLKNSQKDFELSQGKKF